MNSITGISSVAYKKGNWLRYTLWGTASICIGLLLFTFFQTVNGTISASVPEGYKFSVTDNYAEGSKIRTTYYVYEDRIFVEDESFDKDTVNRTVFVYDNINTDLLSLDANDTTEICELGSCHSAPKVLSVVKKLVSQKVGREYIGL